VETYYDRLYRWLYHLTRDRHTAEDLTQDTFLKAFAGLDKFEAGTNFQAWLFRIGHNNLANHARSSRRKNEGFPEDLPDPEEGPVERTLHHETQELVARAVARLPADFRSAFLLRLDEGLSFREIATVLDITEETARWRVFKARQKLLAALQPEESARDTREGQVET
jgi:RNA polymerase sigma-70 factor (ECF subfamily)